MPIRSAVRPRMNETACIFATSIRLEGAKSSASMLLEISIAITIEMPSRFSSTVVPPIRGPAAAMIQAASARARAPGGIRANQLERGSARASRTSL